MSLRRLLRGAVTATLLAGLVGALRQRREARDVRRGLAPVASSVAGLDGAERLGPVGRALADWVPAPPRTPVARALAVAWAAPLTAVGLVLGVTSGGRLRWDAGLGALVVTGAGGLPARLLAAVGATANAIGHVIVSRAEHPDEALLVHEAAHVRQAERLGPLLFPLYLWLGARYGYRDHPIERGAREAVRRWRTASGAAGERPG